MRAAEFCLGTRGLWYFLSFFIVLVSALGLHRAIESKPYVLLSTKRNSVKYITAVNPQTLCFLGVSQQRRNNKAISWHLEVSVYFISYYLRPLVSGFNIKITHLAVALHSWKKGYLAFRGRTDDKFLGEAINSSVFAVYLQWAMMGPASGGLQALTLRRKLRKGVGYSGTPWSGQAVNWNWRTSLRSLQPLCGEKHRQMVCTQRCASLLRDGILQHKNDFYQVFKRHRRVGKFVCVWSPGYIYINNDLTSSLVPVKQAATQLFFKPNDPPQHHTTTTTVYWHCWIFQVHYSRLWDPSPNLTFHINMSTKICRGRTWKLQLA